MIVFKVYLFILLQFFKRASGLMTRRYKRINKNFLNKFVLIEPLYDISALD